MTDDAVVNHYDAVWADCHNQDQVVSLMKDYAAIGYKFVAIVPAHNGQHYNLFFERYYNN